MAPTIGHFEKVRALAAHARLLAVAGTRAAAATAISLFDHVAGKTVKTIDVPAHVLGLAFAGDKLAAACADGRVRVFEPSDGSTIRSIDAHAGSATAVAAAPGGGVIASVGVDGALRLWKDASKVAEFKLSSSALRAVAFDPAGEMVAAAGDDGRVRVITIATGAQRDMAGHEGPVFALAFTPRDGRLASGGDDGTIRIWYLVGDVECETRGADASERSRNALTFARCARPSCG